MNKIERDESYQRDYIPIGAGWEIQTKGKGSTYRISDANGRRLVVPDSPYLYETLTEMAMAVNASLQADKARIAELEAECARLRAYAENMLNMSDGIAPERNCSCHIMPPCGDCVDWAGFREASTELKAALRGKETT